MEKKDYVEHRLYGGKTIIRFRDSNHSYWLETDEQTKAGTPKLKRLAGVTTHIGMKDKSKALIPWAVGVTVNFIEGELNTHLDNIRKLLNNGDTDTDGVKKALSVLDSFASTDASGMYKMAQEEAERMKEEAGAIGTLIHNWAEQYINSQINGDPMPEMPEDERVQVGAVNFLGWVEDHKVKFIWSERVVFSKEHRFIGTADIGAMVDGIFCMVDIKTGNGLYSDVKIQTSAYLKALIEELGETEDYLKGEIGRIAIRISKENENQYIERMSKKPAYKGKIDKIPPFKVFEHKDLGSDPEILDRDFEIYLALKKVYEWDPIAFKEMRS